MQLLLQNVQNLSFAIQSLLKAIDTAFLRRHDEVSEFKSPLWIKKKAERPRVSSLALKKKELEGSGKPDQCMSQYKLSDLLTFYANKLCVFPLICSLFDKIDKREVCDKQQNG